MGDRQPRKGSLSAPIGFSLAVLLLMGMLLLLEALGINPRLSDPVRLVLPALFIAMPLVIGAWAVVAGVRVVRRRRVEEGGQGRSSRRAAWGVVALGVVTFLAPALIVGTLYALSAVRDTHRPVYAPRYVPPQAADIQVNYPIVSQGELGGQIRAFTTLAKNDVESRRDFCRKNLEQSGLQVSVSQLGDVIAVKPGHLKDCVFVGAHYDKGQEPSNTGLLDNMLGCILVSEAAKLLAGRETQYTYVFLCYGDEETGRRMPSSLDVPEAEGLGRPAFILEVDYVGDKRAGLVAYYLLHGVYGYRQAGMKLTAWPQPHPGTIHSERDNIESVGFKEAHLAYKSMVWMLEGIERGDGLKPPPVAFFMEPQTPASTQPLN